MSPLSKLVRGRRLELRLTQREAAERAGVSLATWQNLERPTSHSGAFQELTLSCVAHGLGLDAATVFAAAGQAGHGAVSGGADSTARGDRPSDDIGALVAELEQVLHRLGAVSMDSVAFVCNQAATTAGFLLSIDETAR